MCCVCVCVCLCIRAEEAGRVKKNDEEGRQEKGRQILPNLEVQRREFRAEQVMPLSTKEVLNCRVNGGSFIGHAAKACVHWHPSP